MKIALINENSQALKNNIIYNALKEVADKKDYEVLNFGMYGKEGETSITYVEAGLLAAILLNAKVVDFVVTGCGTGEGAMLAANSFPNVICGHISDPSDAYMFSQINDGNAVAIPFAKGFGWGAELNLKYMFEKLFEEESGGGYPKERSVPEKRNKKILDEVKKVTYIDFVDILKNIDRDLLLNVVRLPKFKEYFFQNSKVEEITEFIRRIM